jgi:hypothetical protein
MLYIFSGVPCDKCAPAYSFKNHLKLTEKTDMFAVRTHIAFYIPTTMAHLLLGICRRLEYLEILITQKEVLMP